MSFFNTKKRRKTSVLRTMNPRWSNSKSLNRKWQTWRFSKLYWKYLYSIKTFDVSMYHISVYVIIPYFRIKLVESTTLKNSQQPNTCNCRENQSPSNHRLILGAEVDIKGYKHFNFILLNGIVFWGFRFM